MKELLRRFRLQPRLTTELVVASLFANLLALAMPIFVIQVLNRYVAHGINSTLVTLTVGALIAVALELAFQQVRLRLARQMSEDQDLGLLERGYRALVSARAGALESLPLGERQQTMTNLASVQSAYSAVNVSALLDVPFAILFLVVLALLNPILGIVATVLALIGLAAGMVAMRSLRDETAKSNRVAAAAGPLLASASRDLDTVRAFNAARTLTEQWSARNKILDGVRRLIVDRQGLLQSLVQMLVGITGVAMIAIGAVLVVVGELDIGALIGANILAARALQPITRFAQISEVLVQAEDALTQLKKLIDLPQEPLQGTAKKNYSGRLTFKDVAFAYPGATGPLFESLDLEIGPGQIIGVTGANGTGKSTLARMIAGIVLPVRGEVLADGISLRQLAPEWWRRQLVYLPQEPALLTATIRDNIAVNNPELEETVIQDLIDQTGLREFVDQSTDGIATPVLNGGQTLALGIRRRIAMARALAAGGQLVILDEPTEGLDKPGAEMMTQVVRELHARGRTVIVLTHEPSNLKGAEVVVDLNSKPEPRISTPPRPVASSDAEGIPGATP